MLCASNVASFWWPVRSISPSPQMTTSRDEEDRGLEEKYLEHEVLPAFWCLSAVSCMAVVSKTTLSAGHATCAAAMHCSYRVHCSPDDSHQTLFPSVRFLSTVQATDVACHSHRGGLRRIRPQRWT